MTTPLQAPNEPAPVRDTLLTEVEAAAYLNVAVQTVRNWRWRSTGPKYYRVGERCVRYKYRDLQAFIDGNAA